MLREALRELIAELTNTLASQLQQGPNIRTDQIRDFIRANWHLRDFKPLALTMMLLAEEPKKE